MNMYKVKKNVTLIMAALIPAVIFEIMKIMTNSILYSYIGLMIMVVFSVIIGRLMLNNPFTGLLEGKGILTFMWDSRGRLIPFLVGVNPPLIQGKFKNKTITDVFDRKLVGNMSTPIIQEGGVQKDNKGNITIELDHEKWNSSKFQMYDVPVIFYNEILDSTITKDMLSEAENNTLAEHQILYQNKLIKELDKQVAPFARGSVDAMNKIPGSFVKSPWFWIIIAVLVIILGAAFLPKIISLLQGSFGGVSGAVNAATTVMPK